MKAYLVITGVLFALIAILHAWRSVLEWTQLKSDPWYFLGMAGLGVVAALLSLWAWRLWRRLARV